MPSRTTILQARWVSHRYDEGPDARLVLDNLSLDLRAGELVTLMGPSGSGKSTLLAVLSGLECPTAGGVWVDGEDIWAAPPRRREELRRRYFGFVFQGYNLFPTLTAVQQLEIVLRWCDAVGRREARTRSERMLARLGLGGRARLLPAQLSGGEKQRVALARALVKEPAVLFADEPTSALDGAAGREVMTLLREVCDERGTTCLVVSHDPRTLPFADRAFELDGGKLRPCSRTPPGALAAAGH